MRGSRTKTEGGMLNKETDQELGIYGNTGTMPK